jgi:hypothetical protein
VMRLQVEVLQKLSQEVACGQREAPSKMLIEDHRFSSLRRGHQLAVGGAATHKICRREHPALVQQLDLPLLYPGSLGQRGRGGAPDHGRAFALLPRHHPGADLYEQNGDG